MKTIHDLWWRPRRTGHTTTHPHARFTTRYREETNATTESRNWRMMCSKDQSICLIYLLPKVNHLYTRFLSLCAERQNNICRTRSSIIGSTDVWLARDAWELSSLITVISFSFFPKSCHSLWPVYFFSSLWNKQTTCQFMAHLLKACSNLWSRRNYGELMAINTPNRLSGHY